MSELNEEPHYLRRMPRRPRRAAALIAVPALLALVSAAACSSSSGSGSASASSPDASSSTSSGVAYAQSQVARYETAVSAYPAPGPALDAQKVAALKGKTVLFVPDGLIGPFVLAQQAVQTALGHVGVIVKTCDPNFLPPQVAACFGQAKTDGAVAVITAGIPYDLAANAYQALEKQHIPVMVSSAGLGSPANTQAIAFQTEVPATSLAGTLGADEVIADSGGKANVLYVSATGASGVEAQAAATKAEFAKYCPGCKVDAVSFDATATTQISSGVSSQLVSDPAANYVLAQSDALLPYILPGIQSSGFTNKVKIVSGAGAAAALMMIQQHQHVIADTSFDASYIGWNAADGVLRLLTGVAVPADPFIPIHVFTATNLSGVQLSAAMNVNPLYGSDGYQQMFYDLWAGKAP
jgi:ribose transport system substrate-binding protein